MVTHNNNKVLNVPTLRFPEFRGKWEPHLLTDYLDFKNGMNPDANRFGKGTKFISVMDILNNRYICYDNIRALVDAKESDFENFGVGYGDMLFQRSSETLEDVGRANVYLDNKPAIFGGFVIRGKKKGDYNPLFFRYLLASPYARKRIIVKGAGAQHFNIGQDGLSKVLLNFPTIKEQDHIAELLNAIDDRIDTQNKIIGKLQSLIKGISKQITHMSKTNVRLKDCLDCHTSALQESDVNEFGAYPAYGANGIVGYTDTKQATNDAILIIKDGSGVGKVYSVTGDFSVTSTLNYLTAKENYSLQYIYFCLNIFNFQPYKTGMAIPHIYFKDYGKAKIYCPKYERQISISKGLTTIESKITLEQKLLNTLTVQKQYLLQQMFI